MIEIHEGRHDHPIRVAQTCRLAGCPACGGPSVGDGTKPQGIRDAPVRGKRVLLEWARRRHLCRACGETTYDRHEAFDTGHRMTGRPVEPIGRTALRRTFASVAEAVGVEEKTVSLVRAERSGREIGRLEFATPRWLGMDEVHLVGKARAAFANVGAATPPDRCADRSRKTVAACPSRLPDEEVVEVVSMGKRSPCFDAVRALLPTPPS